MVVAKLPRILLGLGLLWLGWEVVHGRGTQPDPADQASPIPSALRQVTVSVAVSGPRPADLQVQLHFPQLPLDCPAPERSLSGLYRLQRWLPGPVSQVYASLSGTGIQSVSSPVALLQDGRAEISMVSLACVPTVVPSHKNVPAVLPSAAPPAPLRMDQEK